MAGLVASVTLLASPALAKSHVHPKIRKPVGSGYYSLVRGLLPGHRYRLIVSSRYHVPFAGSATEDYDWISNKQFGQATKTLQFKGTAPRSFTIGQPVAGRLTAWRIAIQFSDTNLRPLRARLVDLGKHK